MTVVHFTISYFSVARALWQTLEQQEPCHSQPKSKQYRAILSNAPLSCSTPLDSLSLCYMTFNGFTMFHVKPSLLSKSQTCFPRRTWVVPILVWGRHASFFSPHIKTIRLKQTSNWFSWPCSERFCFLHLWWANFVCLFQWYCASTYYISIYIILYTVFEMSSRF